MKKKLEEMSKEELQAELKSQQEATRVLEKEKSDLAKAIEAGKRDNDEPNEAQWGALEKKFDMTREELTRSYEFHRQAAAPLYAQLQRADIQRTAAANSATLIEKIKEADPQYPKFATHVKEYLADVSELEMADPEKAQKHLDRAVHFARGKARSLGGDNPGGQITDNTSPDKDDTNPAEYWGEAKASFAPLTIVLEKRVEDDYRKLHQHPDPDQKGAIMVNEKAEWKRQTPQRPTGVTVPK